MKIFGFLSSLLRLLRFPQNNTRTRQDSHPLCPSDISPSERGRGGATIGVNCEVRHTSADGNSASPPLGGGDVRRTEGVRVLPRPRIILRKTRWFALALLTIPLLTGCNDMWQQPKYRPLEPSRFWDDGTSARPLERGVVAREDPRTLTPFDTGRIAASGAQIEAVARTLPADPSVRNGVPAGGVAAGVATPNGLIAQPNQNSPIASAARTINPDGAGAASATTRPTPNATNTQLATQFPLPVTKELLERGQQRYDIYCSMCHGYAGEGNGIVVQRGFPPPPSFHSQRLRAAPVGHYFDVMTNGYGAMYSYADRVKPADRWAIAAYIRALQRSQNATIDDVPASERAELK